jgi:XTP/dITP diphosphohydrolase
VLQYVTTNAGKVREALDYLDGVEQLAYDYPELQAPALGPIAAAGARAAHAHAAGPVLVDDAGLFVHDLDGFPGPYSSYVEDTLGVERVRRLVAAELSEGRREAHFACVLAYCDGGAIATDAGADGRDDPTATGADGRDDPGPAPGTGCEDDGRATVLATVDRGDGDGETDSDGDSDAPGPPVALFEGRVYGRIVPPRGDGGFGYDPIFEPLDGDGRTFAELSPTEKNDYSHRGRALAAFADWYDRR